ASKIINDIRTSENLPRQGLGRHFDSSPRSFPYFARTRLRRARNRSGRMKPAPFRYIAVRSLDQALELKAEHGDEARFLAGGQSLMPTLNFRLSQPAVLIDINPLAHCAGV